MRVHASNPAFPAGVAVLAAIVLLATPSLATDPSAPIPGFDAASGRAEQRLEEELAARLDAASTARHFRYLTEEPHPAGSARNHQLALYVRDRFLEYGLEQVELVRYDVLLPQPRAVSVEMVEPFAWRASLTEDGYPQDKDSWAADDVGITHLGMSGSGRVTAPVVYAHSGNPEDYDWLASQGIEVRGKIVLVRYSNPYSYRGFKAWEAERRGVAALLIYSDPQEDGFRRGEVFPDGPWGPESHLQRGAITYDFIVPGDPLTPGWPSVEGARRIPREEARSVPHIPAVPLSWRDARPILESLGGPVAPFDWQGALPFTYHVGPGAARLTVEVDMDDEVRPIWVVTGRIRGSEEPGQEVILGNHRDAWVYGGVDPSSGTASLLETARVLGGLARDGQRPRRTLVLASWDAEELHLTGSTEWGEQLADELGRGAVAYLNVDSSTSGPLFTASAVASLDPLIVSVARDVIDPDSRHSLLDTWRRRTAAERGSAAVPADGELVDNELGSGSDYTVFLNYLGVPVVDLTFDGPYGVYHSQYDDLYWMEHFGDPGYRYMTAMVEVWGRLALRLANAPDLPYDLRGYAATVGGFLDALAGAPGVEAHLDLAPARVQVAAWQAAAARVEAAVAAERELESPDAARRAARNAALLAVERQLLLPDGIPGRPWFKHVLYAPRYTYAALSLPGVVEAAEAGDWERARAQLDALLGRLGAVTAEVERAATAGVAEADR